VLWKKFWDDDQVGGLQLWACSSDECRFPFFCKRFLTGLVDRLPTLGDASLESLLEPKSIPV
jgi:hypothetical protein